MHSAHPYTQATWYPYSDNEAVSNSPPHSSLGTPQESPSHPSQSFTEFRFIFASGNVKNSVVAGPHNERYFAITTSPSSPGFTVIKNGDGHDIGAIGWQKHAFMEIPGIVARQTTKQWIGLAANFRYRMMDVKGQRFFWVPEQNVICLYNSVGGSRPGPVAKVTDGVGSATLEIMPEAIQAGLLEICVVVAGILFASRCNLE